MEFRAEHILVKTKAEADEIYLRAKKGENFETLARRYSICPSKSKGGDLGWFKEGSMVREFENEVRKMGNNTISRPIRTSFGYHVIKKLGSRG